MGVLEVMRILRKLMVRIGCLLLLSWAGMGTSWGKPFVFEGFVETAPTNFVAPVTHVMRFDLGGKIELALVGTANRLLSRPLERVKILGEVASARAANGVPVIRVEEVGLAEWNGVQGDFSRGRVANWDGFGSSLYPSIAREPLPEAGFGTGTVTAPAPLFYLTQTAYEAGTFRFRLFGLGGNGWTGIVDASTNLVSWDPIATNTLIGDEIQFTDPAASNSPARFYRARMSAP